MRDPTKLHELALASVVLALSLSSWEVDCMSISADNIGIIEELLR